MNIKIGILNVPKHGNKHDLIHFVTVSCKKKKLLAKCLLIYNLAILYDVYT